MSGNNNSYPIANPIPDNKALAQYISSAFTGSRNALSQLIFHTDRFLFNLYIKFLKILDYISRIDVSKLTVSRNQAQLLEPSAAIAATNAPIVVPETSDDLSGVCEQPINPFIQYGLPIFAGLILIMAFLYKFRPKNPHFDLISRKEKEEVAAIPEPTTTIVISAHERSIQNPQVLIETFLLELFEPPNSNTSKMSVYAPSAINAWCEAAIKNLPANTKISIAQAITSEKQKVYRCITALADAPNLIEAINQLIALKAAVQLLEKNATPPKQSSMFGLFGTSQPEVSALLNAPGYSEFKDRLKTSTTNLFNKINDYSYLQLLATILESAEAHTLPIVTDLNSVITQVQAQNIESDTVLDAFTNIQKHLATIESQIDGKTKITLTTSNELYGLIKGKIEAKISELTPPVAEITL